MNSLTVRAEYVREVGRCDENKLETNGSVRGTGNVYFEHWVLCCMSTAIAQCGVWSLCHGLELLEMTLLSH